MVQPGGDQHGQQMVEFAFTFIMLVVLLLALVVFGWMFFSYATITHASREGSRHLMSHPTVPQDQVAFATADEEATWVVTNSLPMLDWRRAVVTVGPPLSQRVPGGYVFVEVSYTTTMPQLRIPMIVREGTFVLGGPIELRAVSRRSLD